MLLLFSSTTYACDGCNIYSPVGLNSTKNRLSVYARQRKTLGTYNQLGELVMKHSGHSSDQGIWGKSVVERYQTLELRGDFFFYDKLQFSFVLPFTNNIQTLDGDKRFSLSGISDPTLLLGYNFNFNKGKVVDARLTVGGGFKYRLGLINLTSESFIPNLDFQPGTGANSVMAFVNYRLTYKDWSFFTSLNYKKNGFNEYHYKYGETVNSRVDFIYKLDLNKTSLLFLAGAYAEWAGYDEAYEVFETTGGTIYFANLGVKWMTQNTMFHLDFQPVVHQQLNGENELLTQNRINIGLTYVFN
ncbi:hypothetical protein DNU06_05545 [Putridiphycobacter roseus]|uniref:Transporter n=2 Tax=Putridiphycobacter roseus TaxID=2219161 RepID=A0A2W1N0J8_9FLAO|nr:hypothetical protein DNU06_05545 [Putridiphycobacter roseus]